MGKLCYVCKYTPVELLRALGAEPVVLDGLRDDFERAEEYAGPSICGFGKSVLEAAFSGEVDELVLVSCCDAIRGVADILEAWGGLGFLHCLDLPHCADACGREWLAGQMRELAQAYGEHVGRELDADSLRGQLEASADARADGPGTGGELGPYVGVLGARMASEEFEGIGRMLPLPARNLTCVHNREVGRVMPPAGAGLDGLLDWYAGQLLGQLPCMRMMDAQGRRRLLADPHLAGIVYHTVNFCDFYSFEYAELKERSGVPCVKVESDFTRQGSGQMATRIEAFAEALAQAAGSDGAGSDGAAAAGAGPDAGSASGGLGTMRPTGKGFSAKREERGMGAYYVGVDSGSTSTDVVVIDGLGNIVASVVTRTGAGARGSAEQAVSEALAQAGIASEDVAASVATGYGREAVRGDGGAVTEITCHAKGARFLYPQARTIIDIGGQDSKAILLDDAGAVANFTMNDKCAAGTGRFLEMMARTLELDMDEMAARGLDFREDIVISSTCSVFAESEVVGLIAQDRDVDDIVHGLDGSVAGRTCGLVRRIGGRPPYMMTGGVSRNRGVVAALERNLGEPVHVDARGQLAGALGAALIAAGK